MKVEQPFACHHTSEEGKVPLAALSFQRYALYWWTSLVREIRIQGDSPVVSYNRSVQKSCLAQEATLEGNYHDQACILRLSVWSLDPVGHMRST